MNANCIVVNATALKASGALTILKQFIANVERDRRFHYICFIPCGLNLIKPDNVTFIEVPQMSWFGRILWDFFKLKQYLKRNNIFPYKVISLQNTSINLNVEQVIYLHQPLPFSPVKWSFFNRFEYKLFLYKYFYKYFIFMFVSEKTIFVVQTKWMKEVLVDKHNINKDNVYIIRPEVNIPKNLFQNPVVKHRSKKLLYPATTVFYKNHLLVLEALKLLKESDGIEGVVFQVTFNKTEYPQFDQAVSRSNLHSHIEYLGVIPYERLMTQYREAALILFPSYVETFGLPLAEAAILGKLILCSDLPYSRDVLENYSGARFLDYQQPQLWADEIKKSIGSCSDDLLLNQSFDFKQVSTWDDFFKLI